MTDHLDPSSAAGQVLAYMLEHPETLFCRQIFPAVHMSPQRVNQALAELQSRGLVRYDSVRTSRGASARRWQLLPAAFADTADAAPTPRTTVERALATRHPLQTVWMEFAVP
jgi:hypothetical protein